MNVAIIGAGIAGLTAARELRERGAQVTVFEKSRGLGGRLATKRLHWGHVDIGAQYFTARDERFKAQVDRWMAQGFVARWEFTPHAIDARKGLVRPKDSSIRYVGTPSMNSLAHALADKVEVRFNSRIQSLTQSSEGWRVEISDGEPVDDCYDWVVLSLPAEQSQSLLADTPIGHKIPQDIHQACWALALATCGEVAPEIQGIFGDELVSWVSRLSARPQRNISKPYDDLWMLHFAGEWSDTKGKHLPDNFTQLGLEWLSATLNKPLKLAYAYPHYWRYARVKPDKVKPVVIADKTKGLAAIGDWSAGGRVEGAYLSALDFVDYFFD
ncbi:hypothetical protein SAMN02745866_03160 [Alteromonadaceae bacterium Bs31]|nr:hypothetical protein SAMN02745866_03160 [Alteromonadaceae bacterium Bs31]